MINLQIDKQHGLLGSAHRRLLGGAALTVIALWLGSSAAANAFEFTPGDLVIDTVSGTTLDSASPMTLQQFSLGAGGTTATSAGSLTLPQTGSGPISGEYGSASEGFLTQSVNGQYLAIMGYGVNASTFNAPPPGTNYGATALGQTTSLTGQSVTTVPRVVALIGGNGGVNTSTALTGVFNTNNPRSAVTVDGSSFYVSGQAGTTKGPPAFIDPTQGVFSAQLGATTATVIDNSTDTRALAISSVVAGTNTLYVSRDFNASGSAPCGGVNANNCTDVSRYNGLPTSIATSTLVIPGAPSVNGGNTGSIDLTTGTANGCQQFPHRQICLFESGAIFLRQFHHDVCHR